MPTRSRLRALYCIKPHATRRTPHMVATANRAPTVQDAARSCIESRSGYLPLTLRKSASRVPAARSTRFAPFPSCRITSRAGTVQELPRTATPNRNLCESTLPPPRVALSDTVSLYFLRAFATFCANFAAFLCAFATFCACFAAFLRIRKLFAPTSPRIRRAAHFIL